jgi:chromate transporter
MTGALSAITAAVVGVIMNLAVWFALHVLFRQIEVWEGYGLSVDVPVWPSINIPALVLTVAAILAIFQFKVRMIPTLAVCSVAGALWFAVSGGL